MPYLALEVEGARQLVEQIALDKVAAVEARAAVVGRAGADLGGADQPAAEGVIDLQRVVARHGAGDAGQRGLVDRRGGVEPHRGEPGHGPYQRSAGEQALQVGEARVLIGAPGVADGGLAGEQPRELEGGTGLRIAAVGIAQIAVAVGLLIVAASVEGNLAERPEPRHQVVADAREAAILVEVAVVVAGDGAVGELRLLIDGAVGKARDRHAQPVEVVLDAGGAAERGRQRIFRQSGLDVGRAGVVGEDAQPRLRVDPGIAADVDAAVDLTVEVGTVDAGRHE